MTLEIHRTTFESHPLFTKFFKKNRRCLAFIGTKLHPRYDSENSIIYKANDEIATLIVVNKGIAAFVSTKQHNAIFALVDPSDKYASSS